MSSVLNGMMLVCGEERGYLKGSQEKLVAVVVQPWRNGGYGVLGIPGEVGGRVGNFGPRLEARDA